MSNFHFDISLSILNHLGRNLYRNFITIIGEAISNSWDADAKNVYIFVSKDKNSLFILDDGVGMDTKDFQDKFLNIGYSKRDEFGDKSEGKRPFIGRKGIGKLALLSCAKRIHIATKKNKGEVVGGVIDNGELDEKIRDNKRTDEYPLGYVDSNLFSSHPIGSTLSNGTIIFFEDLNEGIRNSLDIIRKLVVLHFRFSLVDPNFTIHVNNEPISFDDIKDLSEHTQFLWTINNFQDPFFKTLNQLKEAEDIEIKQVNIHGFIASTETPSYLNIFGTGEKTGIDLFVNGRLRENNILKNMPGYSTRHISSYLYGQLHINDLDDDTDRFTSSREGVKPGDEKYGEYLKIIEKTILSHIAGVWDEWRRKHKETWDIENGRMPKFQALIEQSKNSREKDFEEKIDDTNIDDGIKDSLKESLRRQSSNNTSVYQDFYILENLFREYIKLKGVTVEGLQEKFSGNASVKKLIEDLGRIKELRNKDEELHELKGKIVKHDNEFNYADMVYLGMLVDIANNSIPSGRSRPITMESHSKDVLPVRNPVMHTNEITEDAYDWGKVRNMIDYVEKLATPS